MPPDRLAPRLLLVLALCAPALATASGPSSALDRIAADQQAGLIDAHTALMQRFYVSFRVDLIEPRYASLDRADAPTCATPLLTSLRVHWAALSPAEKHIVAEATDPGYRAWIGAGGISWIEGNVDEVRAAERATCMSPEDAFPQGGPFGERLDTDHFALFYNSDGTVDETRVGWLGDWFEEALSVEQGEMGFYLPSGMVSYQLLVMVDYLGSANLGGFTSLTNCGMGDYMAYVVINSQWFSNNERLQSVSAHELFHAIQMEYALEEMFFNESPNAWWIEGSAVFMETEVYPNLYNSQASQAARWFGEPWKSITTWDDYGFQYGTFLLPASIRQSLGDSDWFHELWDQLAFRTDYDLIEEFDELLQTRDTDFAEQWGLFLERGATGDFEFNPYLALDEGYLAVDETVSHEQGDYPVDEAVDNDSGRERPRYLGANYVWLDSGGVDDDLAVLVGFHGNGRKSGEDIAWEVRLVAVHDQEADEVWDLELTAVYDSGDDLEAWTGQVLLNDFGEDFDGVYLIASPTVDFGSGSVTWRYTAELTDSLGDGGFVDPPEEVDDDDDGQACGQASLAGRATAGLIALALLLACLPVRLLVR
jgi:hypothetical protein